MRPERQPERDHRAVNRCVLITGCSGGGKSTLLAELGNRGHATIEEPGRRIVAEEKAGSGAALPWVDMASFARRAVAMARSDLSSAEQKTGTVFFDRGLVDAAVALQHTSGVPYQQTLGSKRHYFRDVFLAPPWPEIYRQDDERRHDLSDALEEFERLKTALADLGYDICLLPKVSTQIRADFVVTHLNKG